MCNVDEDGDKEPTLRKIKSGVGRKCVKCDQPGVVVTRIHDSFCQDCYHVYVVHKFRSAIGKSKLVRDGDKVLIAFSGGPNSSALLHLTVDGLSERAHKKLRFTPTLLHVDECTASEIPHDERRRIQKSVAECMSRTGFPSYVTSLEQGLQKDLHNFNQRSEFYWEAVSDLEKIHTPTSGDQQRLKTLLSAFPSTTSKEDFLRNLRRQLIVSVARSLGLKKILTGDCSTRLSIQTLADISQGRGSQVALDTAFSDARYGDIMVLRPVRDLNAKELSMYNRLYGVESVTIPTLTTKAHPGGASIERLTETFVTGLQADFPSTVSNIVRTSEKLSQADGQEIVKCSFCQSPLDTNVGPSSALSAVRFSKKLSQLSRLDKCVTDEIVCDEKEETCISAINNDLSTSHSREDKKYGLTENALAASMCFGCQLSLRDFDDDLDSLPNFIGSRVQYLTNPESIRETMEEKLSDFLINDKDSDS